VRVRLLNLLATLSGGAVPHSGVIQGDGFEVSLWPVAVSAAGLPCLWIIRRRGSAAARRRAAGLSGPVLGVRPLVRPVGKLSQVNSGEERFTVGPSSEPRAPTAAPARQFGSLQ